MKLFMQGMRRSGTTISFDVLSQDPRLDLWYEPFSQGREGALGGGSGLQQVDLMDKIRRFRAEFVAKWSEERGPLGEDALNYGAPRDADLELDEVLPDYCRAYLKQMMARAEHSVFKFTRMYRKVAALHAIAPDARFVLLLRHPREVVCSYMYGKDQKRAGKLADRDAFFGLNDDANPWNSRRFFEGIVRQAQRKDLERAPNFERYLLIWKYTFEHAHADAKRTFGDAAMILRHEDLLADPRGTIAKLYRHAGLDAPVAALDWAAANVRRSEKQTFEGDPRWTQAYARLGMQDALAAAGYPAT